MYLAICLCAVFAVLAITFFGATLIAELAWRLSASRLQRFEPARRARVILLLRLLPAATALALSAGLVLPSFLEYEPHHVTERVSMRLMLLSAAGMALLIAALVRAATVLVATARREQQWSSASSPRRISGMEQEVFAADYAGVYPATLGVISPKIFLSKAAIARLSPEELLAAARHECAHLRASDNLKRFLLRITRLPKFFTLHRADTEWQIASEIAADAFAIRCGSSALDLSSAIVKVARWNSAAVNDQLVCSPFALSASGEMLRARIEHLEHAIAQRASFTEGARKPRAARLLALAACVAVFYIALLPIALPVAHECVELLVRGR